MEHGSKQSTSNQEIDLGQLFSIFERIVKKIAGMFTGLFTGIQNRFSATVSFFLNHIKIIGGATLIGVFIGAALDYSSPARYAATMEVRPNMGSGRSLYKNISYYNALAEQEEFDKLAEVFKISKLEAASLRSFEITPIVNEEAVIIRFDDLFRSLDSLTALNLDFERYQEEFLPYDYSRHIITVEGINKNVFSLLGDDIIKEITENEFYKKQQVAEFEVLNQNEKYLQKSQNKVDKLRKIYLEALMLEAKKENVQGTSINMGTQNGSESKELELFAKENEINWERSEIIRERVRNLEVVSVISDFQDIGAKVNAIQRKRFFVFAIAFFLFATVFAFVKQLWS